MTQRIPTDLANPYDSGEPDPTPPRTAGRAAVQVVVLGGVGAGLQVLGAGVAQAEEAAPARYSSPFLSPYSDSVDGETDAPADGPTKTPGSGASDLPGGPD